MSWIAGDLPSWLSFLIAVGAAVLAWFAWRIARKASYIEFHPNWNIHIDDDTGDVEVKGRVTIISHAAYVGGHGQLTFGRWKKRVIRVQFVESTPILNRPNETNLTFKGKTALKLTELPIGKFELVLRLSDGATKRVRGNLDIKSSLEADKEGSQT